MIMNIALFPGSFDPITLGHIDILKSALKLFDKVVVAVGYNTQKTGLFTVEERVKFIENGVRSLNLNNNIEIASYSGLTIDFCKRANIKFIIRGLRTTTDFEMERVVAQANLSMAPDILTVFIPSRHEYSFISSTVVRDVIINGGDATPFLPDGVDISEYLNKV